MSEIAIVTCRVLPEPDTDQEPLLEACVRAGVSARMVPWDDESVDWSQFGAAVLRSCWNYYEYPEPFRNWILETSTKTKLVNSAETLLWNLEKTYLLELANKGIAIVPTRILDGASTLERIVSQEGWQKFVVKPVISAASFQTQHFTADQVELANSFVAKIMETREVMVQPFISSVTNGGEVSLVHIAGELTHAIVKQPRFDGGEEDVSSAFQPDASLAKIAAQVLAAADQPWIYARVDLMRGDDGEWLLSELEMLEPSLFLSLHPPALEKFASALASC